MSKMMDKAAIKRPFWAMSADEALAALEASKDGLKEEMVEKRRSVFGPNAVPGGRPLAKLSLFFRQLASPLILVLTAAGAITVLLGERVEAGVIFAAVAVNTALGFYQEYKAESALSALRSYIRTRARVRRRDGEREIDAEDLVPGDIIRVSQGDRVPADARLLFVNGLEADEAVLTGESLPVIKDAGVLPAGTTLADRTAMIYSGTLILEGAADAVVAATGSQTEFGRIAELIASGRRASTPLERSIARFTVRVGAALACLVILLFVLGVGYGYGLFEMFLIAVAVAVSAVPEGLPVALTVILAVGVERLAKRRAVVRRLLAAETLGSATMILTDKTGTLTQAKMELTEVIAYEAGGEDAQVRILNEAIHNTDVIVENPEDPPEEWKMFGRLMETALVRGAAGRGVGMEAVQQAEIIDRLPFNSSRKFSSSIRRRGTNYRTVIIGAPEIILSFCDLTSAGREELEQEVGGRALAGARLLGVMIKD